jgi:hypothetical protein
MSPEGHSEDVRRHGGFEIVMSNNTRIQGTVRSKSKRVKKGRKERRGQRESIVCIQTKHRAEPRLRPLFLLRGLDLGASTTP